MSVTPQYLFPPGPYDAALDKAIADAELIRDQLAHSREMVAQLEIQAEELSRLIAALIARLPRERRAAYAERAGTLLPGQSAKPARGSTTYENVIDLFANENRKEWSTPEVRQALSDRGAPADPTQISNVLNYLAKKGRLKRISRGRYLIMDYGVGIEGDPEDGYD